MIFQFLYTYFCPLKTIITYNWGRSPDQLGKIDLFFRLARGVESESKWERMEGKSFDVL